MSQIGHTLNHASKRNSKFSSGFTIVELLVVIVVLGILAGLILVSYLGIKNRADTVAIQSDSTNNANVLKGYQAVHATYPTALDVSYCPSAPTVDSNFCLKFTGGNSMSYYSGTADTFDLRITRDSSSPITYQITESTGPVSYVAATGPPSSAPVHLGFTADYKWRFQVNNTGAPITAVHWYIFVPASCPNNFTTVLPAPVSSGIIEVERTGMFSGCTGYLGDVTWHFWFSNSYGNGPEGTYDEFWDV